MLPLIRQEKYKAGDLLWNALMVSWLKNIVVNCSRLSFLSSHSLETQTFSGFAITKCLDGFE